MHVYLESPIAHFVVHVNMLLPFPYLVIISAGYAKFVE